MRDYGRIAITFRVLSCVCDDGPDTDGMEGAVGGVLTDGGGGEMDLQQPGGVLWRLPHADMACIAMIDTIAMSRHGVGSIIMYSTPKSTYGTISKCSIFENAPIS